MLQKSFSCALFMIQISLKNAFDYAIKMLEMCLICDPGMLQKCFLHVFERTAKYMWVFWGV
jgi:hypothetical protein